MRLDTILGILSQIAPEELALHDDPVGLLLGGDRTMDVGKVGVCLDATEEVARRAVEEGVGLLIAHHPLIYRPLKKVDTEADPISRAVVTLLKADVALYAMHTNWDRVAGGINDTLASLLGLQNVRPLGDHGESALPRLGDLPSALSVEDLAKRVTAALDCTHTSALRMNPTDPKRLIARVGVCGGAGAGMAAEVRKAGADAYITSDVRHHEFLDAAGRGLVLLDAGHQATEAPGMQVLVGLLTERLSHLEVSGVEVVWVA